MIGQMSLMGDAGPAHLRPAVCADQAWFGTGIGAQMTLFVAIDAQIVATRTRGRYLKCCHFESAREADRLF